MRLDLNNFKPFNSNEVNFIFEDEMKKLQKLLNTSINDLIISNGTLKKLEYLTIKTVRDLVQHSKKDILSIPHAGKKTFKELEIALNELSIDHFNKIYFGMNLNFDENEKSLNSDNDNLKDDYLFIKKNLDKLLMPIDKIDFSVRTLHCLSQAKVFCIADLVVLTKFDLLTQRNFGQKSFNEITNFLNGISLTLGMNLPSWPLDNHNELIKNYKPKILINCDFDSIKETLNKTFQERERIVFQKRFFKGHTLNRIGKNLGVTRERVRQIESKLFRKIAKYNEIFKKFLTNERNHIFKNFSNNRKFITLKSLKNFRELNTLLSIEKDAFINFLIISVYKNYTSFLDAEFYKTTKSDFLLRSRGNNSRIKLSDSWRKDEKIIQNKEIKSGVLKLT